MRVGIVYKSGESSILMLELPFMQAQSFLLLGNDKKGNDNAPDFNMMGRVAGKLTSAGGVWNKVSSGGVAYKSIMIEHPLAQNGKINLAVFELGDKQFNFKNSKGVECVATHTVEYSAPRKREDNFQSPPPQKQNNTAPVVEYNDGEEIPF